MSSNSFFTFIFWISVFILCTKPTFAIDTNLKFEHMDISTGLNSNTVYCTFQDSNGQMWFGTNDGLTITLILLVIMESTAYTRTAIIDYG